MKLAWSDLWQRLLPAPSLRPVGASELLWIAGVVLLIVLVGPLWRVARLGVTLAHEIGHALIGVLVGRKFVGFVLRGDMSGHAVTSGPVRGLGRVLTTWAGYPAPGLVGLAMVALAAKGWAAALLTFLLLVLLVALIKVRSVLTALVTVAMLAGGAALWWFRDDLLQRQILFGAGLLLLIGGWRHLIAVVASGSGSDDPAVLASLTHLPKLLWHLTFVAVFGASSWYAWRLLYPWWP